MDENNLQNNIAVSEQNAILKDLRLWLKEHVAWLSDKTITISSLNLIEDNVSIVPTRGIRKRKQYACGGYQVYFPFNIYYRTSVEGNSEVETTFDALDDIGSVIDSADLNTILSGDRSVDSFYQDTTTVLLARKGSVCDFMASYVLLYSN